MKEARDIVGFRLSPQQEKLWLLQRGAQKLAYKVWVVIAIDGRVDRADLREAIIEACNRHEILRTRFHCPPGSVIPIQVIDDAVTPEIPTLDLSNYDARTQEQAL